MYFFYFSELMISVNPKKRVKIKRTCELCGRECSVLADCQACRTCFCSECGDVSSLTCRVCSDFNESSKAELDDLG